MAATKTQTSAVPGGSVVALETRASGRINSIDALRGLVVFTMIFVNDLAGAPATIVPDWMRHFHGKSGMTFVDLVFPGFLFIVGMSIPFALGSRLSKGKPAWKVAGHVLIRTLCLLWIGIMMVNETPDSAKMGWSGTLWCVLMYLSAMAAFCSISLRSDISIQRRLRLAAGGLRVLGMIALLVLAFAFRGEDGHRIVSLTPFSIHASWYGILGLIGWSYLVGSLVFLAFRCNRTGLLGCMVLLLCLYAAEHNGMFENFWLARYVGIGGTLGSLPSITVAGALLATVLITPTTASVAARIRFGILFVAACAGAALLVHGLYGINKNAATPSWCLWSCAIAGALWVLFYFVTDVHPVAGISRPFTIAGQNVLLAYLISEMLPSVIDLIGAGGWYGGLSNVNLAGAIARSVGCSIFVLAVSAVLNRLGFRLKL